MLPELPGDLRPLTEREFDLIRALVYREAGIHLAGGKQALVSGRLAPRLRALGLTRYGAYYERACEDPAERAALLEALCIHETQFFREPHQFALLSEVLLPRLRAAARAGLRPRRVRAWSAGCATGEEPFSVAMVLAEALPPQEGWSLEVVATDLSARVLARARQATWPLERARHIPPTLCRRYMLRGTGPQEGRMRAGPELRALVHFRQLNLHAPLWPALGTFDLILCRNVLIYFDTASRAQATERLLRHLAPDGHLFLGHAESLTGSPLPVRPVAPSVYTPVPLATVRADLLPLGGSPPAAPADAPDAPTVLTSPPGASGR